MDKSNKELLKKAVDYLKSLHFDVENIMVTGSIALDEHGVLPAGRKAHDVDFIIKMDDTTWKYLKLWEAINADENDKLKFSSGKPGKYENTVFLKHDDVMLNIWKYNQFSDWSDIKDVDTGVYVATVNHIIIAKKMYGRDKDYRDIYEIVKNLL